MEETKHTLTPWEANIGDRLSDDTDCWVIDSEQGSIAEMQCPKDVEEINARFIVEAVNSYGALRAKVAEMEAALRKSASDVHKIGSYHNPDSVSFEECKRPSCIAARAALAR